VPAFAIPFLAGISLTSVLGFAGISWLDEAYEDEQTAGEQFASILVAGAILVASVGVSFWLWNKAKK
jgi:hypothetical protein